MKVSWLAFGCPHIPLLDPEARQWLLENIREYQPQYLIGLGDWHEADAVSRFGTEYDWGLDFEMDQVAAFMVELEYAAPQAKKVWLEGNHDANIRDWHRTKKQLVNLIDYRKHHLIKPLLQNWEWVPYVYSHKGTYRLGQITFAHGYETGVSADENQAIKLGVPYGLYVGAHTHKALPPTQATKTKAIKLPYYYANSGTLRDLDSAYYMERKYRNEWSQGLVLGECELWRYDKGYIPSTCNWWAETKILKTYKDLN